MLDEKSYNLYINSNDKTSGANNNGNYDIDWDNALPKDYDAYKTSFNFQTAGGNYKDYVSQQYGLMPANSGTVTMTVPDAGETISFYGDNKEVQTFTGDIGNSAVFWGYYVPSTNILTVTSIEAGVILSAMLLYNDADTIPKQVYIKNSISIADTGLGTYSVESYTTYGNAPTLGTAPTSTTAAIPVKFYGVLPSFTFNGKITHDVLDSPYNTDVVSGNPVWWQGMTLTWSGLAASQYGDQPPYIKDFVTRTTGTNHNYGDGSSFWVNAHTTAHPYQYDNQNPVLMTAKLKVGAGFNGSTTGTTLTVSAQNSAGLIGVGVRAKTTINAVETRPDGTVITRATDVVILIKKFLTGTNGGPGTYEISYITVQGSDIGNCAWTTTINSNCMYVTDVPSGKNVLPMSNFVSIQPDVGALVRLGGSGDKIRSYIGGLPGVTSFTKTGFYKLDLYYTVFRDATFTTNLSNIYLLVRNVTITSTIASYTPTQKPLFAGFPLDVTDKSNPLEIIGFYYDNWGRTDSSYIGSTGLYLLNRATDVNAKTFSIDPANIIQITNYPTVSTDATAYIPPSGISIGTVLSCATPSSSTIPSSGAKVISVLASSGGNGLYLVDIDLAPQTGTSVSFISAPSSILALKIPSGQSTVTGVLTGQVVSGEIDNTFLANTRITGPASATFLATLTVPASGASTLVVSKVTKGPILAGMSFSTTSGSSKYTAVIGSYVSGGIIGGIGTYNTVVTSTTVTVAPSNVVANAGGGTPIPDTGMLQSDGSILFLDGSKLRPNGDTLLANGDLVLASGLITIQADGSVATNDPPIYPHGQGSHGFDYGVLQSDGTRLFLDGSSLQPDGSTILANGNIITADGLLTLHTGPNPSMTTNSPALFPHGQGSTPTHLVVPSISSLVLLPSLPSSSANPNAVGAGTPISLATVIIAGVFEASYNTYMALPTPTTPAGVVSAATTGTGYQYYNVSVPQSVPVGSIMLSSIFSGGCRIVLDTLGRSFSFDTGTYCPSNVLGIAKRDSQTTTTTSVTYTAQYLSCPPKTVSKPTQNNINIRIYNLVTNALLVDTDATGNLLNDMTPWYMIMEFTPIADSQR